jgi:ADP-heptose:LPS heptosyltransferase
MVAELDLVICIHTSVNHLAGALGVPAWVLVPTHSQWRYGTEGDSIPWYKSLKLIRQKSNGDWSGPINKVVKELGKAHFQRH